MRNFIVLFILFANFFSAPKGSAHWDDQFDASMGHITKIVKIYPPEEGAYEYQELNNLEFRNRYRKKANIETDRLKFQTIVPSDIDFLYKELFDQENIMKYYEEGRCRDLEYVQRRAFNWVNRWDTSPFSWWILKEKESNQGVGALGCYLDDKTHSLEIACLLMSTAQSKGYMTEALQKGFMPYALQAIQDHHLTCDAITVPIHPNNEKSINLAKRVGNYYPQYRNSMTEGEKRHYFSLYIGSKSDL